MNIKSRFLVLTALLLLLTAFFTWLSVRALSEQITRDWVGRYAEKQVRYDKVRTLRPIIEEVELSLQLAAAPEIKAWAQQPENEKRQQQGLALLEAFRTRFFDESYFIALKKTGQYYHNNARQDYKDKPYRYTLSPDKPTDAWFYQIMAQNLDMHLNVNPDVELGVVKLWVDVLIRDGDEILGVAGTGLDLSMFLEAMLEQQEPGSAILFTNHEGSIQLYQDQSLIDYATITKDYSEKKLIFQLLDDQDSQMALRQAFIGARQTVNAVETALVYKDGRRHLAGVIYIPEIDWFEINLIDLERFLPFSAFVGLLLTFFVGLCLVLVVLYVALNYIVTRPLANLETSISALAQGRELTPHSGAFVGGEIRRLMQHFAQMSAIILENQANLEAKVAQRTHELNQLAKLDPLTQLYNRRGFEAHLTQCMLGWQQKQQSFGLISLDLDDFKYVNDHFGHIVGDLVLQQVAQFLTSTLREDGDVARWGGDEFLVLVYGATPTKLADIRQRLHAQEPLTLVVNDQSIAICFSIGCAMIQPGDVLEDVLQRSDNAMFEAKFTRK